MIEFFNEEEVEVVPRTQEENKKFLSSLEDACDDLAYALTMIEYRFEELNKPTKEEIRNIIGKISHIQYSISERYTILYKPE